LSLVDFTFWIPQLIALTAVVLTYVDMRRRQKQDREFAEAQAELIDTFREELELFRKQLNQGGRPNLSNDELEQQKLLQRRSEQQWRQMRDLGKAIGWILKHSE
jgi:hypothetical protein